MCVVQCEPGRFQVGTLGPVVIMVLHDKPRGDVVEAFHQGNDDGVSRCGAVAHLILLARRGVAPDAEVRQGFARVLRRFAQSIVGEAVVLEARGVGATMTRSIVRLIHAAGRTYHPHRVTGDLADACSWLCGECVRQDGLDDSHLAKQVRALSNGNA